MPWEFIRHNLHILCLYITFHLSSGVACAKNWQSGVVWLNPLPLSWHHTQKTSLILWVVELLDGCSEYEDFIVSCPMVLTGELDLKDLNESLYSLLVDGLRVGVEDRIGNCCWVICEVLWLSYDSFSFVDWYPGGIWVVLIGWNSTSTCACFSIQSANTPKVTSPRSSAYFWRLLSHWWRRVISNLL